MEESRLYDPEMDNMMDIRKKKGIRYAFHMFKDMYFSSEYYEIIISVIKGRELNSNDEGSHQGLALSFCIIFEELFIHVQFQRRRL